MNKQDLITKIARDTGASKVDAAAAIELRREANGPGDAILVKGCNSIVLAALVEALASGKS